MEFKVTSHFCQMCHTTVMDVDICCLVTAINSSNTNTFCGSGERSIHRSSRTQDVSVHMRKITFTVSEALHFDRTSQARGCILRHVQIEIIKKDHRKQAVKSSKIRKGILKTLKYNLKAHCVKFRSL